MAKGLGSGCACAGRSGAPGRRTRRNGHPRKYSAPHPHRIENNTPTQLRSALGPTPGGKQTTAPGCFHIPTPASPPGKTTKPAGQLRAKLGSASQLWGLHRSPSLRERPRRAGRSHRRAGDSGVRGPEFRRRRGRRCLGSGEPRVRWQGQQDCDPGERWPRLPHILCQAVKISEYLARFLSEPIQLSSQKNT